MCIRDCKVQKLRDLQVAFQKHTGVRDYSAIDGVSPGICHQVAREEFIEIGDFIQATDSHTCMGGASNALTYGVGATEYASLVYSGFTFVKVPESIRFELVGTLGDGCTAKDVILFILSDHAREELTLNRSMEFGGPGLSSLSIDERATLCNMATECSGRTGICEADDALYDWMEKSQGLDRSKMKSLSVLPDEGAKYDGGVHVIDLSLIVPMVAHPGDPDKGIPSDPTNGAHISDIGDVSIDIAYGGSCTAGKEDDMAYYAEVCQAADDARFIVKTRNTGGSSTERLRIKSDGFSEFYGGASFVKAGFNYVRIGSTNASGATLALDGDANGDGSGADYCMFRHDTDGHLKIYADNPANAADTIFYSNSSTERMRITSAGNVLIGTTSGSEKLDVSGWIQSTNGFKTAGHPIATYASFTDISGGSYATRLGSTGTSTIRSTQIYGGGNHIATFDGVNYRLGINETVPRATLDVRGTAIIADDTGNYPSTYPPADTQLLVYTSTNGQPITNTNCARLCIATDAKQVGPQGYNGAIDFGNSDVTASGSSVQFSWRLASIMSEAGGDTGNDPTGDGDLQFWTKTTSGNLTRRVEIKANGDIAFNNCTSTINSSNYGMYLLNDSDSTKSIYLRHSREANGTHSTCLLYTSPSPRDS